MRTLSLPPTLAICSKVLNEWGSRSFDEHNSLTGRPPEGALIHQMKIKPSTGKPPYSISSYSSIVAYYVSPVIHSSHGICERARPP